MDLNGAMDMLKNMLESDDGKQQIQNILSVFGGAENGDDSKGEKEAELYDDNDNNTESDTTFKSSVFSDFSDFSDLSDLMKNGDMLLKLQKVMTGIKSAETCREAEFLKALSPLLKPERRNKVDRAVKILGMGRVIKLFKEM